MSKLIILFALLIVAQVDLACHREADEAAKGMDSGDPKSAAEKVAQADQLYAQREDLTKIRQAIPLLREAQLEDYGSYEAAWKLARADYFLGDHTSDDRERDNAFREGTEAAKAAVKLQPGKPEGHFWLGANYGGAAKNSMLAGLSSVEDIRQEMETVIKLDEGFQAGSAYLALGQLYLQAPKVLGGDSEKAIQYLEKGLRFGNDNALLHLRLAEAYHAVNRDQDARKQIDFIMSMKPSADYQAEYKEAQEGGRKLQGEMKGS